MYHCVTRCLLPLAFATVLCATSLNANNDSEIVEVRQPRVTGRIVKLYSGSNAEPIQCTEEGFQGDPLNCAVFYRCIKSAHGKFTIFRFQCGPGTIYDPDTEVCNHPKSTKRSECYETMERSSAIKASADNDIEEDVRHELPSPIDLNRIVEHSTAKEFVSSIAPKITPPSRITLPPPITNRGKLSPTTIRAVAPKSNEREGDTCTEDGFIGDSENCRKFYRCVANGRGGFIRYEFSCSESTVWDDETQGCNHPWTVKRRRCGRDVETVDKKVVSRDNANSEDSEADASTIQEQLQINYGNRVSQLQLQINNGTKVKQNQTQINYGDEVKQNQKQENYAPNSKQTQKQISRGSAVSQSQKQVNYGDKTTQNQVQIDHTKQSSQSQQQTYLPPDSNTKPQASQSNGDSNGGKCTESGFMGDSNDCSKFYRCVDNGKGSYTKYEFSCGDGTVWDQNIEACNHAWAVKNCGGKPTSEASQSESQHSTTTTTTSTARPTQAVQSTQKTTPTDDDVDNEPSYGNQNHESSTEAAREPESKPQTTTTESTSGNSVCKSSGFIGDSKDCKKFYRCVDNGNGSYTKYEFSCGDGTVWDQRNEACNHAWAVEKCGGTDAEDIEKVETTTEKETQSPITQSSATQDDDNDSGYGQPQEETSSAPTSTTKEPIIESSTGNECKTSGFMGDDKDCKKFYRCVDNGNGAYTRYEFSCGEGTVWDQSIEACNHAWAVKKCGGTGSQGTQSQTESVHSQETTTTTSSTESTDSDGDDDQGYNQPSSQSDSTTAKISSETNDKCTQEGFMGDRQDCKKFYRCVDNSNGGYTKYEFTCGEGTIWDQEIQVCNHPPANKKCGGSSSSQSQTTEEPKPDNDESYTQPSENTTTESSKTTEGPTEQTPQMPSVTCESEGFFGDSSDCKKFYRCVDNGKGGYTKYDFACGDGTVWDQEIQGCNHDTGKCKQSSSSGTTQTSQEATTKSQEQDSTQSSGTTSTTEKTSTSSPSEDKCMAEGFYANSKDCKKFYRCVDNGKGGFTKYEFTCGEGTVWVQELQACDHDNDVSSCSSQSSQSSDSNTQPLSEKPNEQSTSTTQSQTQSDETQTESSSKPSSESDGSCSSEGFYANKQDCKKFYRCVDNGNGGYTKFDFTCGEGTAWDSDIQACNHISEVKSCDGNIQEETQTQSGPQDDSTEGTTESTQTSTSGPSSESSKPSNSKDSCTEEGFFGNSDDCKKFYRCVDNGKGSYTKYDFTCGEGTIWDQDITACNHPRDVANPSCSHTESQSESSSSSSSTTEGSSQGSSSTMESSSESSDCTQDDSSKKPAKGNITCDKEGFHANPNDCKKFYRCVDWDGDGKKFSVFHFDCGEGTIWDPALETCNYEDSVYPPRDCSGTQSQSGGVDEETTTTESTTTTTTEESTTTTTEESTTTTESETTTTQQSTTQESTTQSSTTEQTSTEKTTTQASTSSEQTTTQESTTSEQTTTQQSTTSEQTTTQQSTTSEDSTSEQTTTEQTTTEKTTTQESTTSEQTTQSTTTEGTTTQESTTQESTTSEQTTTQESTTTEGTTESTTSESTTQDSTEETNDSTTESSTDGTTTEQSEQTTTESSDDQTTTEQSSESEKECPETDDDQYLYVCPTGFRRHPKYCDMFYQCSEDDDTHEVKVATFNCPNNTIYDESQTQCVDEDKAEKKCDGQKAQKRRFKRLDLNSKTPIVVSKQKHSCPAAGHFPFEKDVECSPAFLKCEKSKAGKVRGMVYRCPDGFVYWSVSRRCEPKSYLRNCKNSANDWSGRWEIPLERRNVAP